MITAVSSFTANNSKSNSANYYSKSNTISRMDNSPATADSFRKSNPTTQIAFTGNPLTLIKGGKKLAKAGESLLGDTGSKLGKKASKTIGKKAKSLSGNALEINVGAPTLQLIKKEGKLAKIAENPTGTANKALASLNADKELPVVNKPLVAAIEDETKKMILSAVEWVADKAEPVDPTPISSIVKWVAGLIKDAI